MARAYIPPMKPVPDGATKEDRQRMFDDYKAGLVSLNRHHFNPDGTRKSMWQWVKRLFT